MKNYFSNNFFVTQYKYCYLFIIGCLLSFSLPPYNQTWISFFAFPLLLFFLIKNQYSSYKSFFIFLVAYLDLVIFFVVFIGYIIH